MPRAPARPPVARSVPSHPRPPGGTGSPARPSPRGRGNRAASGRPVAGRRHRRARAPPRARPPRASGRSAGPARPPSASRPPEPEAASPPTRPADGVPAPRPRWRPAESRPAWRSARCWSPRRRSPTRLPAAPARRCAVSTGSPWSHSSITTLSRPNTSTSRATSREAARGPASISAAGTAPFRQPLSTSQRSPAARASASRVKTGLPFSPPSR